MAAAAMLAGSRRPFLSGGAATTARAGAFAGGLLRSVSTLMGPRPTPARPTSLLLGLEDRPFGRRSDEQRVPCHDAGAVLGLGSRPALQPAFDVDALDLEPAGGHVDVDHV